MSKSRVHSKIRKKWIPIIIIPILVILGYSGYVVASFYSAAQEAYVEIDRPEGKSELREEELESVMDPISILLLGVENYATDGESGRADAQIVVTLNPHTKKMTMTSIPRDTRVNFSEEEAGQYEGYHKINAAYTYGTITGYGENNLAVKKTEELLDIPIDEYVAVNFDGFRDIVDALGGVTVDVKESFWEDNFYRRGERINFEKGLTELNGEEALAFVRMRKRDVNYNYTREERQRQFLKAVIDEAISTNTIFKVGEISRILGNNVTTSISPTEIFHLQQTYSSINTTNIKTLKLEGEGEILEGIYYFIPDEEARFELSNRLKEELEITAQTR